MIFDSSFNQNISLNTYYFIQLLFQPLSQFLNLELYPFCRPKNMLEAIGVLGPMSNSGQNSLDRSRSSKVIPSMDNTWLRREKWPPTIYSLVV